METIGRVRRDHFVRQKSIKEIARERGLSRNTVRKILRSGKTELTYERGKASLRQLGSHVEQLEQMLEANRRKGRRERLTLKRMFELLRADGFQGGYDSVRRYGRRWQREHGSGVSTAFVPLRFKPAEAFQFDWSHEIVILGGATTTVKVAHIRLCYSRYFLVIAYLRETQEMVFDAHDRAFRFFSGACVRGIYDNMGTAVDTVFAGKERKFNRRFEQMCSHYLVEPVACTPASGWEKGQVENQVGNIREWLFTPRLRFANRDELNDWLMSDCVRRCAEMRHPEFSDRTLAQVFEEEKTALIPHPGSFDGFHEDHASASKTCLVNFDRNQYSVAAKAARKPVQIRAYAERIVVRLDGEVVADHPRRFGRGQIAYDPWHYLPVLERKPGALRNGAPFENWALPPMLAAVRQRLGKSNDADREFVSILAAVPEAGLSVVEAACGAALEDGVCTSAVVLNHLARQQQPAAIEPVETPATLALSDPPRADCHRYDQLREREDRHGAV